MSFLILFIYFDIRLKRQQKATETVDRRANTMTKLTQWLFCIILFLSLWLAVIGGYTPLKVARDQLIMIYLAPVLIVAAFGIVSLFILAYRVITFNNCEQAARELIKVSFIST